MITKKTTQEIQVLDAGGSILATILETLKKEAQAGVSTQTLDDIAMELAQQYGVEPVLLGYHPTFADNPYPAATCISVNNCVQHGIPSEEVILERGDIVNLDMTISYEGMIVDSGISVGVGDVTDEVRKLLEVTREALTVGIKQAQPGNHIGDISYAIQTLVESRGMSVVRDLCGHGVGYAVHEEPNIPNHGSPHTGPVIEVGHVYAIEPIVNMGQPDVVFDDDGDGYGVWSADQSWSAQFEHTVAITAEGPKVLTKK